MKSLSGNTPETTRSSVGLTETNIARYTIVGRSSHTCRIIEFHSFKTFIVNRFFFPCQIGNHDSFPRAAARFGDELLDGIHMTQLLLPGTPVVYMADELGMTSTVLRPDQYVTEPGPHDQRVLSRSPFQWDSTPQAGFSRNHKPWLPVNPNYVTLNAKDQSAADRSHLTVFNKLVQLRRSEVFRSGDVRFHEVSEYVFAFSRY